MPELAEVQTVLDTLKEQLGFFEIQDVEICYDSLIATSLPYDFVSTIKGKKVTQFLCHGKYLIFDLDTHYWMVHLRMEGKYFIRNKKEPKEKHHHVFFHFTDGSDLRNPERIGCSGYSTDCCL